MSKQMLELADRITNHLVTLASTNMKLSLTEWGIISNDILSAVATLRSSAVSADPIGYLLEKSGVNNGFYFVEPASYKHVEERFRSMYRPVYAQPVRTEPQTAADKAEAVIAGLNKQLTEQFELSTKYAGLYQEAAAEIEHLRALPQAASDDGDDDGARCERRSAARRCQVGSSPKAGPQQSALALAIRHIEHMAAWITEANSDYHVGTYSFESLGEDLPGIRAALASAPSRSHAETADKDVGNDAS